MGEKARIIDLIVCDIDIGNVGQEKSNEKV